MTGEELRKTRQHLNMSQEELARRLGMTRTPITEWEANKRPVPSYIVLALAEIRRQES